mmetsp:Transcript_40945/g.89191  ORF Transcript_40945/g.89191 Transcript_40945/m.89191 type:complete len:380 (+) Transcript_40945:540-1679(+)
MPLGGPSCFPPAWTSPTFALCDARARRLASRKVGTATTVASESVVRLPSFPQNGYVARSLPDLRQEIQLSPMLQFRGAQFEKWRRTKWRAAEVRKRRLRNLEAGFAGDERLLLSYKDARAMMWKVSQGRQGMPFRHDRSPRGSVVAEFGRLVSDGEGGACFVALTRSRAGRLQHGALALWLTAHSSRLSRRGQRERADKMKSAALAFAEKSLQGWIRTVLLKWRVVVDATLVDEAVATQTVESRSRESVMSELYAQLPLPHLELTRRVIDNGKLDHTELTQMRVLFLEEDQNGAGEISREGFRRLAIKLGVQATGLIFEQMWFSVDVNGDGSCQFWEFAVWWRHYREAIQGRLVAEAARTSPVARRRADYSGISEESCD